MRVVYFRFHISMPVFLRIQYSGNKYSMMTIGEWKMENGN